MTSSQMNPLQPVLDQRALEMTRIAITSSGSLSAAGTLFVLVMYFALFRIRSIPFHLRMVLYLAVTDFLAAVSGIFAANYHYEEIRPEEALEDKPLADGLAETHHDRGSLAHTQATGWCVASGAMVQFFLLASVLLTVCIGHMLDSVVRRQETSVERFEVPYLVFALLVPAASTAYCVLAGRFGDAGLWCWIQSDGRDWGALVRFLCFYLWVLGAMVYLTVVNVLMQRKLARDWTLTQRAIDSKREALSVEQTLRWIAVALVVLWIPGLANRIQNVIQPGQPVLWLYVAHAVATPLQGFVNSLIIGVNDEVRYQLRLWLSKHFSCCNPDVHYLSVQDEHDALVGKMVREGYDYRSESDFSS
jgi:Slime mold cyclic AMP receptor